MEYFFLWLGLAVALGVWASNKGRSGFGWFVLACLISPLLAFVFFFATDQVESPSNSSERNQKRVKCPYCAELVLPEAVKCKHCGSQLSATIEEPVPTPESKSDVTDQSTVYDDVYTRSTEKKFYIGLFVFGLLGMILIIYFHSRY